MAVQYKDRSFLFLLFRWRGSVWKSTFRQYLIYLALYYTINLAYRFALNKGQRATFERLVVYFDKVYGYTPVQFILGFYVSSVLDRWWNQLNNVAWPDKFLSFLAANMKGNDVQTRVIRRTLARYCTLVSVLVWKEVSLKIKKRFPTDEHVVKSGLMTETEFKMYNSVTSVHGRWFVPVTWMKNLLAKCRDEKRITEHGFQRLLDELWDYRKEFSELIQYDWINIPLVYTQVVTLATYGYFAFTLIGRQAVMTDSVTKPDMDIYFPFLTTLEFLFYVSWLKVGEELLNPFGEDDEDFDMNYILDRNFHVAFMLVDEIEPQIPPLEKDAFWNNSHPLLPHTKASAKVNDFPRTWRLAKTKLSEEDQQQFHHKSTWSSQLPLIAASARLRKTTIAENCHIQQPERIKTDTVTEEVEIIDDDDDCGDVDCD